MRTTAYNKSGGHGIIAGPIPQVVPSSSLSLQTSIRPWFAIQWLILVVYGCLGIFGIGFSTISAQLPVLKSPGAAASPPPRVSTAVLASPSHLFRARPYHSTIPLMPPIGTALPAQPGRGRRRRGQGESDESSAPADSANPSADPLGNADLPKPPRRIDSPLPRSKRRKRRAKADRGLAPDEELTKLARTYLERQRKHWPQLAEAGLLPAPTEAVVRQMVLDFQERHRAAKVDAEAVRPFLRFNPKLGGSYNRYSSDNSSPNSALDQMVNALDKAHAEGRFVPWQYVFADYSVTGLDASRQGYSSYKAMLGAEGHPIETTYIDDFTRASRDELEWWKLAALSKRLNKRMIGASDGFDLSSPDWDIKVTIYGLLSRLFIKGLREKVRRGMRGAARRGASLGKPPLGFTRCVRRDEHGREVRDRDGLPGYEPCIDPETRDDRLLMYELFVQQNWSSYKITRHFNKLKVDGWDGWTDKAIKQLLRSPTAIGVFIWNQTRREFDWDEEKWKVVRNPRSEWEVHYDRNLAIVPMELWRAARRKLAVMRRTSPLTGRKPSRNQVSPTTLFSGTLFCEHCGGELKLIRSTPSYKQMGCFNGLNDAHDCKLSSSKSVRIIEECLLGYIRDTILTDRQAELLVAKANAALQVESEKPQVKTGPWKAEIRKLDSTITKLIGLIEEEPDQQLCAAHNRRAKELQKRSNALAAQVREAESRERKAVKPVTIAKVKADLDSLREVLGQEVTMAAEALRAITGPIKIRQEPVPGFENRYRWVATFGPDLFRAISFLAQKEGNVPESLAAERSSPQLLEVPLEKIPRYELLAPVFKQLRDNGASVESIATSHRVSWQFAVETLKFADTGDRPRWQSGKKARKGGGANQMKYKAISAQVVELRDQKKMPFRRIAKELKVGEATARRAYDYGRPAAVRQAAERGERPNRGSYSHLGEDVYKQIRKLLKAGWKIGRIAEKVGCGASTVGRVKQKLDREDKNHDAA